MATTTIGPVALQQPSVRDAAESIVPDGGIIKIPIRPPQTDSNASVSWARGTNARIHYTVYAYVPEDDDSSQKEHAHHDHACCDHKEHSHHNEPHSTQNDDSDDSQDKVMNHEALMRKKELAAKTEHFRKLLDTALSKRNKKPSAQPKPAQKPPESSKPPVRRKVSDSREYYPDARPFDLRIGYNFSVRAMELCVKSLKMGERARFLCMPEYCQGFAQLETVMRQERQNRINAEKGLPPVRVGGCCAHATAESMDLTQDLLPIMQGVPLEFDIELVQVQSPSSFAREPWEMDALEKYREAPLCKEEGSKLYRRGDISGALAKYERALVLLESLSTSSVVTDLKRERFERNRHANADKETQQTTSEIDLDAIDSLMLTCRLNYAACKLKLGDFVSVITQCTEVLKHDNNNVKALFRRAQAYRRNGRDLDLAQKDLDRLRSIFESAGAAVYAPNSSEWTEYNRERTLLQDQIKAHESKERQMFGRMFT